MNQTNETSSPAKACLNCGAPLQGRFCCRCGQKDEDRHVPLKHILLEVFHDVLHFDARFFQTVSFLFSRPGQLTVDYMDGRRSRHLPPFRLYIFVSFVLFLLLGFGGSKPGHRDKAGEASSKIELVLGDDHVVLDGEGKEVPEAGSPKGEALPGSPGARRGRSRGRVEEGIIHGVWKMSKEPEAFREHLLHWISRAMFVLLPAFALLLQVLFRRQRRFFVEHFVLSLHFHAFVFSVFILQWVLGRLPIPWMGLPAFLLTFLIPFHLAAALRRVYGATGWKLHVKGILLTVIYLAVAGLGILGAVALSALH